MLRGEVFELQAALFSFQVRRERMHVSCLPHRIPVLLCLLRICVLFLLWLLLWCFTLFFCLNFELSLLWVYDLQFGAESDDDRIMLPFTEVKGKVFLFFIPFSLRLIIQIHRNMSLKCSIINRILFSSLSLMFYPLIRCTAFILLSYY